MTPDEASTCFQQAHPDIEFLATTAAGWAERRATRGQAGQELKPAGIAIPKDAQQVAAIARWAASAGVDFTVRSGGNDFYGRNAADDALIIDMRDMNHVSVDKEKMTATVGGGILAKELMRKFEEQGVVVPFGNTWIVGYVGWATLGGYGPLTGELGMGYEGIVGAEMVNGKGEVVQADEEMLEGIRGMGGNLGIITTLTVKVYPSRKVLAGMLVLEASAENVNAVLAAEDKLGIPKPLTVHHFILKNPNKSLIILFTWGSPDHDKGHEYLDTFTAELPGIQMKTVDAKTVIEQQESAMHPCLPWGGQRSIYIKEMTPDVVKMVMEALDTMPQDVNMGWSMTTTGASTPANTFGAGTHILFSFSDLVSEESRLPEARKWNDALYDRMRSSGSSAIMEGSYPPLTRPGDRSAEQLFGEKYPRARALKGKFDPENVFKYAVPRM